MPAWVNAGVSSYVARLPRHLNMQFRELASPARNKSLPAAQLIATEGQALIAALDDSAHIIALDERGREMSSRQLATEMEVWLQRFPKINFLIGGASGLSAECRQRADFTWSLSQLTLPHALVRVVLAEQIYRAWTLLQGHPYHRD